MKKRSNIRLEPSLIKVLENATFEDLMKMWPKEPVIRQDPPLGVAKEDWEHIEREYQHFFGKKNMITGSDPLIGD